MNAQVCRQAQRGSTAYCILVVSAVVLYVTVFGWPLSCERSAPAGITRQTTGDWRSPRSSTPEVRQLDGMRHLSEMTDDEMDNIVLDRLETEDEKFNESGILELLNGAKMRKKDAPCMRWNPIRLREAYINIVPNFHDTSKDVSIKEEQARRQRVLRKKCQELRSPLDELPVTRAESKSLLGHVLVNDRYKVLYCYVPRAGSTNWKKVFKVLSGWDAWPGCYPFSSAFEGEAVPLSAYTHEEKVHRLGHYHKFMFVRDPLARLVSAYNGRFSPNGTDRWFYKHRGKNIIRKHWRRKNISVGGDDVTWKEFIDYVITVNAETETVNENWAPYEHLCQPCLIDYDFVGRYEQMTDEANYVLRQVKAHDVVAYPDRQDFYHTSSRARVMSLFRTLNASTQQRVLDVYDTSYRLFGYEKPAVDKETI